jgi:hypothetical protein
MGSTLLMVGRLPGWSPKERDAAGTYLARASDAALTSDTQAALLEAWDAAPKEMACLDALNEASTSAFVEHAAALEGLKDFNEAMTRGRWRHLPYWIDSYWLPVRSDTTLIERDKYGWPSFFGSAHGASRQSCRQRRSLAARSRHRARAFRADAYRPTGILCAGARCLR